MFTQVLNRNLHQFAPKTPIVPSTSRIEFSPMAPLVEVVRARGSLGWTGNPTPECTLFRPTHTTLTGHNVDATLVFSHTSDCNVAVENRVSELTVQPHGARWIVGHPRHLACRACCRQGAAEPPHGVSNPPRPTAGGLLPWALAYCEPQGGVAHGN